MALLQATSVLGRRESLSVANPRKAVPLNDELTFKDLETETMCWRQEETRTKLMEEAFSIVSNTINVYT